MRPGHYSIYNIGQSSSYILDRVQVQVDTYWIHIGYILDTYWIHIGLTYWKHLLKYSNINLNIHIFTHILTY